MIEPCAIVYDEAGKEVCGVFHLLTCGHIVAIDEKKDLRCGRNCEHAASTFRALTEDEKQYESYLPLPVSTTSLIQQATRERYSYSTHRHHLLRDLLRYTLRPLQTA
jgi:hypothetical protein